jgi:hypothetical protein
VDLRQYFKKIRETETALTEAFPLLVSLETSDGGKPGTISEVSREVAAKMIVEGRAALASESEKQAHLERQAAHKKAAERAELGRRVQVAIISEPDSHLAIADEKATPPAATRK